MTLDARLIERSDGRWSLSCLGRFRKLTQGDNAVYQTTVQFLEEGAPAALLSGQVTTGTSTFSRTALGNTLTVTHPSADPSGSFTVRMVRGKVDPKRQHSCQVVVKQNGIPVMRSEARPPRQVPTPSGVFVDSGQLLGTGYTTAVALGDLDGDGDLDSVEGNYGEAKRIWRNDGSGTFANTGQALAAQSTFAVVLGDLDADGDLDLFEGNYGSNRVWRNNGSGAFSDSGQAVGGATRAVALADLDGDGDLDAFLGTDYYVDGPSRVWRNNGAGVFSNSGQALGTSPFFTRDVALADLDGDGDVDAFVGRAFYSGVGNQTFLNNGSGVFSDSGQNLGTNNTIAVALGDLDGDGDIDAFCSNAGEPSTVFLNNGSGVFTNTNQALGGHQTTDVALSDVDGDGDLDAFEAAFGQPNRVWLNNGVGTFSNSFQALGNHPTYDVAVGDLDGDGDPDAWSAILSDGYTPGSGQDRIWRNQ